MTKGKKKNKTNKDIVEPTEQEVPEEPTSDTTEETQEQAPEETPEEVSEEDPEQAPEQVPEEITTSVEEGKTLGKMRKNPWIVIAMVLALVCVAFIIESLVPGFNLGEGYSGDICSQIKATPSWVQNGQIVQEGYIDFGNTTATEIVTSLIEDRLTFVYHPDCSWCQKQIESFGDSWDTYVESGLTLNCE